MHLVDRPCPLCGPGSASRVVVDANLNPERLDRYAYASRKAPELMHYRLLECRDCDVVFASPAPVATALAEAYRDAAYDSSEEARFAARTYAAAIRPLLDRLPNRSGALDIGTGDGAFLEELLDMGFSEVVGVEPSAAPVAAARPHVRPLLRVEAFRPLSFHAETIDLVTCFQTLEHLPDPLATCREAARLLRPGGALAVVVHDRRATVNRLMGRRSPIFDIEHLQLFSARSLRRTLESAGLTRVEVVSLVNRYPARYWLRLAPLPRRVKLALARVLRMLSLETRPLSLRVGNLFGVGWREG